MVKYSKKVYKKYYSSICPGIAEYNINDFDINKINSKIHDYLDKYYEYVKPKSYEMNITLNGFDKDIKRKISVDSNVSLHKFCECVICSMKGDLSHLFGIKIGKEYIDEEILEEQDLNYLELKKSQKLKIVYDFGDNWIFNVTVTKVIEDYGKKPFEVLSGKGYGIIDDCGGIGSLYDIFEGINTEWGNHDINDFNLNKINRTINLYC